MCPYLPHTACPLCLLDLQSPSFVAPEGKKATPGEVWLVLVFVSCVISCFILKSNYLPPPPFFCFLGQLPHVSPECLPSFSPYFNHLSGLRPVKQLLCILKIQAFPTGVSGAKTSSVLVLHGSCHPATRRPLFMSVS